MNVEVPILYLVFNRPDFVKLSFERIKEQKPKHLYIAADGPREGNQKDQTNCKKVRDFINENTNWDVEIHYLYRDKNLGCGKAVSEAISWFFSHVEQGIILEDDCLPSPSFFKFCSQLLNRFKHDERIISINGFNFGMELENSNSYVFSKYLNMWGWATWRRSADRIDYEMQSWKSLKFKKLFLQKKINNYFNLDYNGILHWHKMFDNTSNGRVNTWDYQWLFNQLQTNTYAIVPATNLIKNIGFGKDATHTIESGHEVSRLEYKTIKFPLTHNTKISNSKVYEKNYLRKLWCNYTYEPILSVIFKIALLKVKKIF